MAKQKKRLSALFRDNFIAGVLVLAPFGAVVWISTRIWSLLLNLNDFVPQSLNPKSHLSTENPIPLWFVDMLLTLFILGIIFTIIYFVGLVSRNYLGKKLIQAFRGFVSHLPVLKTIYSTLEQLIQTFTADKSKNFRRVVEVDYPRKGMRTLALVTGEREKGILTIFIPTTPNPTSGFYLKVLEEEVKNLDMSVEEALKEIISMGLVYKDGER